MRNALRMSFVETNNRRRGPDGALERGLFVVDELPTMRFNQSLSMEEIKI